LAQRLFDEGIFEALFMISAETGDGTGDLVRDLAARMPEGPWHYPDDQVSDLPLRDIAAEITREHLFRQLRAELPYALTVEPETWEEFRDGSIRIGQQIFVQREGQRSIVLGEGGQRIKAVRLAAQPEIEALTGRKVHLFLHIKVRENWQEDPERYRAMGLDYDGG
jgi:GTP-binding protein Era